MLVLLLGASGAGKSTLASLLVGRSGWRPVFSFVTRPARKHDPFKVAISSDSFEEMSASGAFWSVVEQGGYKYGLIRSEIERAIADRGAFYVLDFGLAARQEYFQHVPHVAIYLRVRDENALVSRLTQADRASRLEVALATGRELDVWYATSKLDAGVYAVDSNDNALEQAALEVLMLAQAYRDQA